MNRLRMIMISTSKRADRETHVERKQGRGAEGGGAMGKGRGGGRSTKRDCVLVKDKGATGIIEGKRRKKSCVTNWRALKMRGKDSYNKRTGKSRAIGRLNSVKKKEKKRLLFKRGGVTGGEGLKGEGKGVR